MTPGDERRRMHGGVGDDFAVAVVAMRPDRREQTAQDDVIVQTPTKAHQISHDAFAVQWPRTRPARRLWTTPLLPATLARSAPLAVVGIEERLPQADRFGVTSTSSSSSM